MCTLQIIALNREPIGCFLKTLQCFCKRGCFIPLFGFDGQFRIFLNYTASYSPACLLFVAQAYEHVCFSAQCQHYSKSQKNITQARADERLARVPKMARGTISLVRGIDCSANFRFSSFPQPASLYCAEHVCVCVCVCACVCDYGEIVP